MQKKTNGFSPGLHPPTAPRLPGSRITRSRLVTGRRKRITAWRSAEWRGEAEELPPCVENPRVRAGKEQVTSLDEG